MRDLPEYVEAIRNDIIIAQIELSYTGRYREDVDVKFMGMWRLTDELLSIATLKGEEGK